MTTKEVEFKDVVGLESLRGSGYAAELLGYAVTSLVGAAITDGLILDTLNVNLSRVEIETVPHVEIVVTGEKLDDEA